jgi:peptidoglycan hydrolase-like protein with peptidoglycan-binding domain
MSQRTLFRHFRALLLGFLAAALCARSLRADEITRQVQEELRKRHLYFGDVDGRFTPEVAAALRRYQERKGFPPSGTTDETTLRSLALLPPPPADRTASQMPDVPVLRSDEGVAATQRKNVVTAGVASIGKDADTPPPIVGSQAAAAPSVPASSPSPSVAQRPDAAAIRAFIERYLQAGQSNDPPAELRFYGDHVNYFDDGLVDQQFIEQDVRRYDRRWPDRQFALAGPVAIADAPDGDPAKIEVRFRYRFEVKGSRYSATGQADTDYVLAGSRPEDLRIVSLKEQRVRP